LAQSLGLATEEEEVLQDPWKLPRPVVKKGVVFADAPTLLTFMENQGWELRHAVGSPTFPVYYFWRHDDA